MTKSIYQRWDFTNVLAARLMCQAVADSGVPRKEIFYTSKMPVQGYNLTHSNFAQILEELDTNYIDLLLLHHPEFVPEVNAIALTLDLGPLAALPNVKAATAQRVVLPAGKHSLKYIWLVTSKLLVSPTTKLSTLRLQLRLVPDPSRLPAGDCPGEHITPFGQPERVQVCVIS